MRNAFFGDLDTVPFDRLVQKYCSEGPVLRAQRRLAPVAKWVLQRVGLLEAAKRVFRK